MSKFWQKKYISKYTGAEIDAAVEKAGDLSKVEANPELAGTEAALAGLQVGDTKYKVGGSMIKATPVTIDYGGTDYDYDVVWSLHITVGGNASTINVVFVTPDDYAKVLNREVDCVIFNTIDPTSGNPPVYATAFVESVDPTDVVLGVGALTDYYLHTQTTVKFIQAENRFYDVYTSTFVSDAVYIAPNTLDIAYESK